MTRVLLVVKGTRGALEAQARGLTVKKVEKLSLDGTAVTVETQGMAAIYDWHAAPPHAAPFPPGTLLFYNVL